MLPNNPPISITNSPDQALHSPTVEWLLAGACFLSPATSWLLIPGVLSWSDAFLLAAMLAYLPAAILRRDRIQVPTFVLAAVTFVIIASLGSFAGNPDSSNLINCLKFLVSLLIIPVTIMWGAGGHHTAIHRILWCWLAGGCLSALVAVSSKYGVSVIGLKDVAASTGGRASGLTYHANSLGYQCALLVPVATYLLATTRSRPAKLACIAAIGLLVNAIILTGSRSSLLAVLAGATVWLPNPFRPQVHRNELMILVGGMLSLVAVIFFITLSDKPLDDANSALSRLLGNGAQVQKSNDERRLAAQIAYDGFEAAPIFGQGFQNIRKAHNSGLQILHCSGLVGFAGVLLWWVGMGSCLWKIRQSALGRVAQQNYMLWRLLTSAALVILVNGTFQPLLTERSGYIVFGLLLGIWLSLKSGQTDQNGSRT